MTVGAYNTEFVSKSLTPVKKKKKLMNRVTSLRCYSAGCVSKSLTPVCFLRRMKCKWIHYSSSLATWLLRIQSFVMHSRDWCIIVAEVACVTRQLSTDRTLFYKWWSDSCFKNGDTLWIEGPDVDRWMEVSTLYHQECCPRGHKVEARFPPPQKKKNQK